MSAIALHELSQKPGLFIRETADEALSQVGADVLDPTAPIEVDFTNIMAVTPSFAEQLIRGIKARLPADAVPSLQLRILHAPPHTARTFTIVGRAHGMVLEERSETEWLLRPRDETGAG